MSYEVVKTACGRFVIVQSVRHPDDPGVYIDKARAEEKARELNNPVTATDLMNMGFGFTKDEEHLD